MDARQLPQFESDDEEEETGEFDELHIKVSESVYFDFVLTCARTDLFDKVTSVFFVSISIAIQLLLSSILLPALASDGVSEKSASPNGNLFSDWRTDPAGGNSPSSENHQWAYWACNAADFSWEQATISDYQAYSTQIFGVMSTGRFFGIVAISLWCAYIVREYKDVFSYVQMIFLPNSDRQVGRKCYNQDETVLQGLPSSVKIGIVLVAACRLVINTFLGYNGVKFLAYTEALKDFVLNSIALGFILDIDELVFSVFIEPHKKGRLAKLADSEVCVSKSRCFIMVQDKYAGIIGFACTALLVGLAYWFFLTGFADVLKVDAYCELCAQTGANTSAMCPVTAV